MALSRAHTSPKADDLAKFLLLKKYREAYESYRAILVTWSDLEGLKGRRRCTQFVRTNKMMMTMMMMMIFPLV